MSKLVLSSVAFVAGLLLAAGPGAAELPCRPFEGGRVDAKLLVTMREAAQDGRLYRIDAGASKVGFCVRHFPFQEFRGEFSNVVGGLAFPPSPAQYGQALLLINTSSLRSNNTALAPLVKGNNFMDTANYPEILFVARRFEWLSKFQAHIYGELTLRGKTHPVIFDVEIDAYNQPGGKPADRIRMRGRSHISRLDFDMHSHRLLVRDIVRLCLDVELVCWHP